MLFALFLYQGACVWIGSYKYSLRHEKRLHVIFACATLSASTAVYYFLHLEARALAQVFLEILHFWIFVQTMLYYFQKIVVILSMQS